MAKWTEIEYNSSQSPLSLLYIKMLRLNLLLLGCWPDNLFGKKLPLILVIQKRLVPAEIMFMLTGSCYFLITNYATLNFFILGHVLIATSLCFIVGARSTMANLKDYGPVIKEFINFHLIHHTHKGEHYKKIYKQTEKVSYYFTLYQLIMMAIGTLLFAITPIYNNYTMGAFIEPRPTNLSLDFAIYFSYPGYNQDDHMFISTAINIYSSLGCAIVICMLDLLICLIAFQIIGHIKTLMLDFETMKRPKVVCSEAYNNMVFIGHEMYDKEENDAIHIKLTEMVKHHKLIVRFVDRVSIVFGPMIAVSYMFHLVSLCILLVECTSKNTKELARFGPLTFNIFGELIQLSVVFEVIGYTSEKLIDSVYYAPWECMDLRNRRSMLILLNRVQKHIEVTALGCVPVGVKTMQAIIKTTLSYFAILQTFSQTN